MSKAKRYYECWCIFSKRGPLVQTIRQRKEQSIDSLRHLFFFAKFHTFDTEKEFDKYLKKHSLKRIVFTEK